MSCEHTAPCSTVQGFKASYDAHLSRDDANRLSRVFDAGSGIGLARIEGDEFFIRITRGHNGAILVHLQEY